MDDVRDSIAAGKNEEHTYPPVTFDKSVTAALADLQAQLRQIGTQVQDLAMVAYQEKQKVEHLEAWVHRLLNPNGDGTDTGARALPDPQDGI